MWNYEKRLQYPINIKTPNAKLAQFIMSQYGGPECSKHPQDFCPLLLKDFPLTTTLFPQSHTHFQYISPCELLLDVACITSNLPKRLPVKSINADIFKTHLLSIPFLVAYFLQRLLLHFRPCHRNNHHLSKCCTHHQ